MSDTFSQQAFGQPTFTDAYASGSSSGRDPFEAIDASTFYHDRPYSGGQPLSQQQIPTHDEYAQHQQFAYALQDSRASVAGKRTPPPVFFYHFHLHSHLVCIACNPSFPRCTVLDASPADFTCWPSMTFVRERMACSH